MCDWTFQTGHALGRSWSSGAKIHAGPSSRQVRLLPLGRFRDRARASEWPDEQGNLTHIREVGLPVPSSQGQAACCKVAHSRSPKAPCNLQLQGGTDALPGGFGFR